MKTRRWFCLCLTMIVILLLAAPLFGEAKRRRQAAPPPPTPDVEANVISLRRLQLGTYVEVLRDDGKREWIDIKSEEGLEVKAGQRVAYSTRPTAHENSAFGTLRSGEDFRILTPQNEDRVYRRTGSDGTQIFTDNPSTEVDLKKSAPGKTATKGKKKQSVKASKKPVKDEVVFVDQEERRKQEAMMEELYKYSEQASIKSPERKAKRAKPRQN